MNDDLILALYPRAALAKDAELSVGPRSATEISLGHIVRSKQDVDRIMQQAERAGVKITDPAHDRFWGGYSGYFKDPDGWPEQNARASSRGRFCFSPVAGRMPYRWTWTFPRSTLNSGSNHPVWH